MLSPRRSAQLALSAASLTLVASITVLVAGSIEPNHNVNANQSVVSNSTQVAPLASGELGSLQADLSQQISTAKR